MRTLTSYLKGFGAKLYHATDEEIEEFDKFFIEFYSEIIERLKEEGYKLAEKQENKFKDLLYKFLFVKREFNERYDNIYLYEILKRVGVVE